MIQPIDVLQQGVQSLQPFLQADGRLFDPLYLEPTQYGTAYYAYCNAVLALHIPEHRAEYLERACLGATSALMYVLQPELPPSLSSAVRETGEAWGINHRDFYWPAILKTYQLLKVLAPERASTLQEPISAVRVELSFAQRPPNNWASVWLSGEWLRYREGLSPYSFEQIENWLGAFFANHILLDLGFYMEPGLPNSYDLFTRYHLADMLLNGYQGRWTQAMRTLMQTGLQRSLDVQLSDGSLASAHRSTGQSWTLSCQCAYLSMAAAYFESDALLSARARQAACRALLAFSRCQRPGGIFSPVENLLPANMRVGYELYSADGHYSSLALAFLAAAVQHGMVEIEPYCLVGKEPSRRIEHDPTFRAVIHNGAYSLHFNAAPAPHYDAFGVTDITFGPARVLQFVSSAYATNTQRFYNPGIALRRQAGRAALEILCQANHDLLEPIAAGKQPASLVVRTRPRGSQHEYQVSASCQLDGVHISESTPGLRGYKTLLLPYLRDAGTGALTRVAWLGQQVEFTMAEETIRVCLQPAVEHVLDIQHGFENRRGLCGLVRIDFSDALEEVGYYISIAS